MERSEEEEVPSPSSALAQSTLPARDCTFRPAVDACCTGFDKECENCRKEAEQALEIWRSECLPSFSDLANCKAGYRMVQCCADLTPACEDCQTKAFGAMLQWYSKCGAVMTEDCADKSQVKQKSKCCDGPGTSCVLCRDRERKLLESRRLTCQFK